MIPIAVERVVPTAQPHRLPIRSQSPPDRPNPRSMPMHAHHTRTPSRSLTRSKPSTTFMRPIRPSNAASPRPSTSPQKALTNPPRACHSPTPLRPDTQSVGSPYGKCGGGTGVAGTSPNRSSKWLGTRAILRSSRAVHGTPGCACPRKIPRSTRTSHSVTVRPQHRPQLGTPLEIPRVGHRRHWPQRPSLNMLYRR